MLRFDYDTIHGEIITAIRGENPRVMNDGSFRCDRIVLQIRSALLEISVNIDTDELVVELRDAGQSAAVMLPDISPFLDVVGRTLGGAWTATNDRGYNNTFMIALGNAAPAALDPAYLFVGSGSAISVYIVERLKRSPEFALNLPC